MNAVVLMLLAFILITFLMLGLTARQRRGVRSEGFAFLLVGPVPLFVRGGLAAVLLASFLVLVLLLLAVA
ncbi:MAG: hypothetical protein QXR20_04450 [Candidatus Caldarchaeum sp.]